MWLGAGSRERGEGLGVKLVNRKSVCECLVEPLCLDAVLARLSELFWRE